MHLELADLLRCTASHESTPLVASSHRIVARAILDGVLGCPLCSAEYPIVDGVVRYAASAPIDRPHPDDLDDLDAWAARTAALLDATDVRGTYLLVGAPVALARAIQRLVPVRLVVVDARDERAAVEVAGHEEAPLVVLRSAGTVPLPAGAVRGIYIAPRAGAGAGAGEVRVSALTDPLRAGGRLVAPAALGLPDGVVELVRDEREWVAERRGGQAPPPALVTLRRRASR